MWHCKCECRLKIYCSWIMKMYYLLYMTFNLILILMSVEEKNVHRSQGNSFCISFTRFSILWIFFVSFSWWHNLSHWQYCLAMRRLFSSLSILLFLLFTCFFFLLFSMTQAYGAKETLGSKTSSRTCKE